MDSFICNICGKKFSRLDNLKEHKKKHEQYQCPDCPKAFASENNLENHINHMHNQTGRGQKRRREDEENDLPSPKRKITGKDNPRNHYTITSTGEQRMEKFNTNATRYRVNFRQLEISDLPNILRSLRRIFISIIEELTGFMDPTDLVRMTVQCPELDYPISLPFMRVSNLTADRLLSEIERVLQSYEEFVIDQSLEINLVHVRLPGGSGRKKPLYVDLEKTITGKKCFIKIKNNDALCCARAIVTAIAKVDQHPKWNSIRKGLGPQKYLAEELHQKAGVPFRRCDLEDVKKFQAVLPEYQIHVVSKEAFNSIVFEGPKSTKEIYLYLHDNHYDIITTMAGFLGRSYYCTICKKGYNTKEKHRCNNPCHYCHKNHDDKSDDWKYCQSCNRYFQNQTCLDLHLKLTNQGNSTCMTYYRCQKCCVTINRTLHSKDHVCGEKYCDTCKEFVADDHLCYMKTIGEERKLKNLKKKRKAKKNDNDEEDEKVKQWIFFDLECTQDEQIQCDNGYKSTIIIKCGNCNRKSCHTDPCEQGYIPKKIILCRHCMQSSCGTYRHVPNLCVVHKVCEECCNAEFIEEHSYCNNCNYNQLIFKGYNTRNDFCKWLFPKKMRELKYFVITLKATTVTRSLIMPFYRK